MTGLPTALASRQRRSVLADVQAGLGSSRGAHVSISGNQFVLINAAGAQVSPPALHLDVVIIDANGVTSKKFYPPGNTYDANSNDPPTCFSDNGTGPSVEAMSPQASTCAICDWNKTGSKTSFSGKPTRACSNRKKLACIIPNDTAVNVYLLDVPPNALTPLKAYSNFLSQQASGQEGRSMDIADVVTRLTFPDPKDLGKMEFAAIGYADDDYTMQMIEHVDANHLSDATVGRNDKAVDPATFKQLGAPTPAAALPPPAAPAPQQFTMPPREAPAQLAAPPAMPAPAPQPSGPPKRRGRQAPVAAPQASAAAPFMAPAAAQGANPPIAAPADLGIPSFLQRAGNGGPPNVGQSPAPPAPRFGVGAAPPPPAGVADALAAAMNLPTRR